MSYEKFKKVSKWVCLGAAAISLSVISYVKWKFIFESGNVAATLVFISILAALASLILGVISLPRWQGIVALFVFAYVTYCLLFTRLYGLS